MTDKELEKAKTDLIMRLASIIDDSIDLRNILVRKCEEISECRTEEELVEVDRSIYLIDEQFNQLSLWWQVNMRYAKIRSMDVSNGAGIGVSLFVQGCHFHCKGCFNKETWDFDGGKEWTVEVEDMFLKLMNNKHIVRVTILGGEPLADENASTVLHIIKRIRNEYPEKKIWLYTGYRFEEALDTSHLDDRTLAILSVDYLIDGRYDFTKADPYNKEIVFAGSTNQRVISIKDTFNSCRICTYEVQV